MFTIYTVEFFDKQKIFISNLEHEEILKEQELLYQDNCAIIKFNTIPIYIKHLDDILKTNQYNTKLPSLISKISNSYTELYNLLQINDDFIIENNQVNDDKYHYIYYNNLFQDAVITSSGLIMNHFPELQFVKIIRNDNNQYDQIFDFVSNNRFNSYEQCITMIDTFNNDLMITETTIEKWITNNYNITNFREDRIKSSVLTQLFLETEDYKNSTSANKIMAKTLTKLGIKKKRYNDGIYWYGLINKTDDIPVYNQLQDVVPNNDTLLNDNTSLDDFFQITPTIIQETPNKKVDDVPKYNQSEFPNVVFPNLAEIIEKMERPSRQLTDEEEVKFQDYCKKLTASYYPNKNI
jgi:hypothetical protein